MKRNSHLATELVNMEVICDLDKSRLGEVFIRQADWSVFEREREGGSEDGKDRQPFGEVLILGGAEKWNGCWRSVSDKGEFDG